MVLQLEDCCDMVTNLYPQYDFLFLVDHSSGHDKQREDGLNVSRMTRNFGGAQRKMRDTQIKQEKGYLGPFQEYSTLVISNHLFLNQQMTDRSG